MGDINNINVSAEHYYKLDGALILSNNILAIKNFPIQSHSNRHIISWSCLISDVVSIIIIIMKHWWIKESLVLQINKLIAKDLLSHDKWLWCDGVCAALSTLAYPNLVMMG